MISYTELDEEWGHVSPMSAMIVEQVRNRLLGIPDISKVDVDLVWEPKWTPHRISPAVRAQLGV